MKNKTFMILTSLVIVAISGVAGFSLGRLAGHSAQQSVAVTAGETVEVPAATIASQDGTDLPDPYDDDLIDPADLTNEQLKAITESANAAQAAVNEANSESAGTKDGSIQTQGDGSGTANTGEADDDVSENAAGGESQESVVTPVDTSTLDIGQHDDQGTVVQDTAFVLNTTMNEAELPDGVASTLYGKYFNDTKMQIVVMGDSQFGNFKGENGIAYQIAKKCKANVYNLAIGGTAIAVDSNSGTDDATWDSIAGIGMAKAVAGELDPSFFEKYTYTYNVFNSCNFDKTDLFILEYGTNDYYQKSPLHDGNWLNPKAVQEAMNSAIMKLQERYPKARFLVVTPLYAQFFEEGTGNYLGDYNSLSNGIGTLSDYSEFISHGAEQHQDCTKIINMYVDLDVNGYNAAEMLQDGVHLTDAGRVMYSNVLSKRIVTLMGYSIPDDVTDIDTVDWSSQTPSTNWEDVP